MTARGKQIAKLLIRILIAVVLLIWVFSQVGLEQFLQTVKTAKWQYLAAVWLFTLLFFWIRSITLQLLLKKQDCRVDMVTLFGASAITSLYSMVMPGLLSTGVKWYILKKDTGKGTNVLSSMLYNQVSIVVAMIVFGLAALIVANPVGILLPETNKPWLLPGACGVSLALVVLVSILLLNARTGKPLITVLRFLSKPLPSSLQQHSEKILSQIALFQTAGAWFHLAIAGTNVIACIVGGVLIYVAAAKSAGITVPVGTLIWLCAAVFVLGGLPISVANLGVREVTLAGLLSIYGVEKTSALLMSMILFSSLIFMAAIGAAFQLAWYAADSKVSHLHKTNGTH